MSDIPRTDSDIWVTDTPRTDAWKWTNDPIDELYGFARQLERELNAANERIKRLEEMYEGEIGENEQFLGSNLEGLLKRHLNWCNNYIKRLEEAGDEMSETTTTPAAEKWRKAKESK